MRWAGASLPPPSKMSSHTRVPHMPSLHLPQTQHKHSKSPSKINNKTSINGNGRKVVMNALYPGSSKGSTKSNAAVQLYVNTNSTKKQNGGGNVGKMPLQNLIKNDKVKEAAAGQARGGLGGKGDVMMGMPKTKKHAAMGTSSYNNSSSNNNTYNTGSKNATAMATARLIVSAGSHPKNADIKQVRFVKMGAGKKKKGGRLNSTKKHKSSSSLAITHIHTPHTVAGRVREGLGGGQHLCVGAAEVACLSLKGGGERKIMREGGHVHTKTKSEGRRKALQNTQIQTKQNYTTVEIDHVKLALRFASLLFPKKNVHFGWPAQSNALAVSRTRRSWIRSRARALWKGVQGLLFLCLGRTTQSRRASEGVVLLSRVNLSGALEGVVCMLVLQERHQGRQ